MMTSRLYTLTVLCGLASLLVMTGCPVENNDADPKKNNTTVDMTTSEDMPEQDMTDDMVDDDMPEDMSQGDATCRVEGFSPRTLPTDGSVSEITVLVQCSGDITKMSDSPAVLKSSLVEKRDGNISAFKRRELRDDLLETYEVKLSGLTPPMDGEVAVTGVEPLLVNSALGEWEIPLRWHLPVASLEAPNRAMLALPKSYSTHGVGVRMKAVTSGNVVLGAYANDAGDGMEMFVQKVADAGKAPVFDTFSVPVKVSAIQAQQFDAFRLSNGNIHAVWWAYDGDTKGFKGSIQVLDKDGSVVNSYNLPDGAYRGPALTRILDTVTAVRGPKNAQYVSVEVVALTDKNSLTTFTLFDNGKPEVNTISTVDGVGGQSAVTYKLGLLRAIRSRNDADADTEKATSHAALDATTKILTIVPFDNSNRGLSAKLDMNFEPEEMFLGPSGDGATVFVLVHGKNDERALFRTPLQGAAGTLPSLQMPRNVDLRPARPQMGTFRPDTSFFVAAGQLSVATINNQATMLGRWPWNWRDKLKTSQQAVEGRWPWNWRERKGLNQSAGMAVQWSADNSLASVHPVVVDDVMPSTQGTAVSIGLADNGTALSVSAAKLDPKSCVNREDCAVSISGSADGVGMSLLPGVKGPTFAIDKYGDILIDGVPLEFDLIGPPIFFRKPGADGTGFDGTVAIAPIVHPNEPTATHAVWILNKDGKPSKPAPISFDFGANSPGELDLGSSLKAGLVTPEDVAAAALQVAISIGVLPAKDDRSQTPKTATVRFPFAALEAAVASDKATVIDVSKSPAIVEGVDSAESMEVILPAPAFMATAAGDLYSDLDTESNRTVKTLATLTPEQLIKPIIVRTNEDGKLVMASDNGDGTITPIPISVGDKEVILNIGFKTEGGTVQIFSRTYGPRFTGKIKRILIKKRRTGSGFQLPEGATVELEEIEVPLPQLMAFAEDAQSYSNDVNGDGLEDEIIVGGYIDNVELRFGTSLVYFADGFGGFLANPWPVVGGPAVIYPPNDGKAAGNGSGTRIASNTVQQSHIELL